MVLLLLRQRTTHIHRLPALDLLFPKSFLMLKVCIRYKLHDVCLKVGIHKQYESSTLLTAPDCRCVKAVFGIVNPQTLIKDLYASGFALFMMFVACPNVWVFCLFVF